MRYFVECTHTYNTNLNTGIQRVVRNIVNRALQSVGRRRVFPVVFEEGVFKVVDQAIAHPLAAAAEPAVAPAPVPADRLRPLINYLRNIIAALRQLLAALVPYPPFVHFVYAPRSEWGLSRLGLAPMLLLRRRPRPAAAALPPAAADFVRGDVLIMLDSSWHLDVWPAVLRAKQQGATVVCVNYDLIPQTHPQFCDDYLVTVFDRWMNQAACHADAFVCISRTVALSLRQSLAHLAPERTVPPRVSYFWLGSELDGHRAGDYVAPREELRAACREEVPAYVYVSTIEPRKNHGYALAAFELLWQRGIDANFVIVGRIGWRCDELIDRIRNHPQLGRRLFMFNDLCDGELSYGYDHARGLIFTSITEGFGLPIVEALQRGLPVFASDIEVFREIAGRGVEFVSLADPKALADALARHIAAGAPRLAEAVSWLSWDACTAQFFERVDNCLAMTPDASLLVS